MTAVTVTADKARFLRLALAADAVVTGGNGLVYLAFAGPVADLLGPDAGLLRGIGAFLLVYGVAVGLLAARRDLGQAGPRTVIAMNAVWTLGSLAAVVTGVLDLTTVGAIWVIAQAVTVAGFAELQVMGLRKTRVS
ncbi:hypothetical protein Nocox_27330 [Nonomuraea coxensis DSM 45129]|uniref:Integral membrane protein n=1 Tax=Nonomuraea coxensis DSM 45129 TaxID=1122611 RepID=A0ABX8U8R8_9ACTN|nr:hypothetical protein [Nonomuraea coxensis]QYC43062.1 hypothetical protein Nocox_27330 [Nonomuraea coxensis DSM 45129]